MRQFISLLAVVIAAPAFAEEGELEVSAVQGTVHMITGKGGNIGVSAGPDGLLMVDDKFADLAAQIRTALNKLGDGPLSFLLNTHYHGDHTGANAAFGLETPIIAHRNVRVRLTEPDVRPGTLPVVTFDRGLSVHFNGEQIEVVHYPRAHTDGDAVIFFHGSNVIHTGDIFFHRLFPYVDIDGGGSVRGVIAAVKAILERADADTKIIPGHGRLATPEDLRTHLRMLEESLRLVQAGMDAGRPLEELQAAGVGEEWAGFSWGFISTDRWVATLHRELTATVSE
ncbi:MAG TPA: MBL fold metallo-hydrolase [Candidatus Latescibacteria bacterium]|nr:MBL fold metallo-hydrolase [Candidatus Latescibacterota bacterium]